MGGAILYGYDQDSQIFDGLSHANEEICDDVMGSRVSVLPLITNVIGVRKIPDLYIAIRAPGHMILCTPLWSRPIFWYLW